MLLIPLGLALLSAAFPAEKRGAAIGIFSAITGLAVASGPLVGGAVIQGIDWEWIFWINVPIGLVAAPLALRKMRESHGPDTSLDVPGLALVAGGAFGIVWGLVRSNATGWGSAEVIGMLAAGVLLVAAFIVWERRAPAPMLPPHLFRSRAFSGGNAAIFFTFASLFGAVFFAAQLMQTGLGYGPLLAPLIVAGVGVSMAIPAAQNSVVAGVPEDALGKAAGANSMMRELGGVFGVAIAVAVFAAAGSYLSAADFMAGLGPALGVSAGLSAAGALAALSLPGGRRALVPDVAGAIPAARTSS